MKFAVYTLLFTAVLSAQAPNPVQTGVTANSTGSEPDFAWT